MATRDRTGLFISYRQSFAHHPVHLKDEEQGLLDMVIDIDCLPPDWSETIKEIDGIMEEIRSKGEILERLYRKNMLPGFDDRRRDEGEMEQICNHTTQRLRRCQDLIKTVVPRPGSTQTETIITKNVQIVLANKVQMENMAFRKKQSAYLQQLRETYQKTFLPIEHTESSEEMFQSSLMVSNEAEITFREREIANITKGIVELSDIFKEIQSLVTDQGSIIDHINICAENTSTHMKDAKKELDYVIVS
ncbi:hypothetical protein T552_01675 [Pneumocystis carinii B80]|uniref:t-SNARE coiled-coil homology domain-containing protein n=1 Tax=Pneumocystis carinii (strain B80) TaxID=1408658 RepID=A0A0W4ZJ53_PNEC8|nr:hypothetical protein T552_01675 [Pneumocystis carinii B80]KTW28413.1 hypothetical protein T552_01675 [Pneumocystis carinii B80]